MGLNVPVQALLQQENEWTSLQRLLGGVDMGGPNGYVSVVATGGSDTQFVQTYSSGTQFAGVNGGQPGNYSWYGGTSFRAFGNPTSITIGGAPTRSNPSTTSGTVYQNTTGRYEFLLLPAYASTPGTDGTIAVALDTSSTPATMTTDRVPGGTTAAKTHSFLLRVPPGCYWSVTLTGATFGTVTQWEE